MSTEDPSRLEVRERQVLWVSGYYKEKGEKPGSFYQSLIECFFRADRHNLNRLKSAFPTTAEAHRSYMEGELRDKYDLSED